ncbi:MAG: ABC transporter substrate-binding protein, partial [Candidatus Eremiobacteraeota bacterium]|nr:ABC transporter substrate-binding protein [Candidatus Eremiobacteraeota bacterium]
MSIRSLALLSCALLWACAAAPSGHTNAPAQRRFAVLVPSLAEDLFALGAGKRVIAVSKFTEIAPQSVPRVADFQSVDTEKIVALHPDAVLGIPAQARLLEPLRHAGLRVDLVRDDTFDDIFSDIKILGSLAGTDAAARAEVTRLRAETSRQQSLTKTFTRRPSV